jgi:pyrophosphate--fructose-6-phosphate 1-phosphotransferase
MTSLQQARAAYHPPLPDCFKDLSRVRFTQEALPPCPEALRSLFPKTCGRPLLMGAAGEAHPTTPLRVGVVFSGGQAAGGHNVISGLFDALKRFSADGRLFGFLGGPAGVVSGASKELTQEEIAPYRNQGGFDLIGSGRTKIETEEQLQGACAAIRQLQLDGLVIIGGDDSNTNAALLAEYFLRVACQTTVVGVPKTIDGDLRNPFAEISFGFDTACKTYAEMIGNIARDALSAKKYTHFIKLMGRTASHIALECALATHPNCTLIGEEVAAKKLTLSQITADLADLICKRAERGKHFGVILLPEGLIEFIPEVGALIQELNRSGGSTETLSSEASACFHSLPPPIQQQLLLDRDPHGNVQVSRIETERLLIDTVTRELAKRRVACSPVPHFFGYEGRAGFPSNFDAHYCYALGHAAALLLRERATGYLAAVRHLARPLTEWAVCGVPLTALMHLEVRRGKEKPVIRKALVDLESVAFKEFASSREKWALEDDYRFPGPIQFAGDPSLTDRPPLTL